MEDDEPPPALVIAGDFNSIPSLQPSFLPLSQAEKLPHPLPPEFARSATYELMASGILLPSHPEHPDAFGKKGGEGRGGGAKRGEHPPPSKKQCTPALASPLRSGLALRDAYDGALCDGALPLSTHADDFAGCIDYIWVSSGEDPPSAEGSEGSRSLRCAPVEVQQVLGMPYPISSPEEFGKIPDATWPSDHLAIGAQIALPRRICGSEGEGASKG